MSASGRPALVALISVVLFTLTGCIKPYGEELKKNGCQLFYTDKVPVERAQALLALLIEEEFCKGDAKTLQVDDDGEVVRFRMVAKPEAIDDEKYVPIFPVVAARISGKVMDGKPVDVDLCDERLATVKTIKGHRWGRFLARDKCDTFVTEDIEMARAEAFLAFIDSRFGCEQARSHRLSVEDDRLALYFVTKKASRDTDARFDALMADLRIVGGDAATAAFDGKPMTVHATDEWFQSLRSGKIVILGPSTKRASCTVYSGPGGTDEVVGRMLDFVEGKGFCAKPKAYRLLKKADGWHVATTIPADLEPAVKAQAMTFIVLIGAMIRYDVFAGAPTFLDLCDATLETCESIAAPDYGPGYTNKRCTIFHDAELGQARIDKMNALMEAEKFCDKGDQLVRVFKGDKGWNFQFAITAEALNTEPVAKAMPGLKKQVSDAIFGGEAITLIITDPQLKVLRTL